jgi:hypothetical protein
MGGARVVGCACRADGVRRYYFLKKIRRLTMKPNQIPAALADSGRIRTGAGIRVLPAAVADAGRVRTGAGIRRAARGR